MIYICGDSFSTVDPAWKDFHWSERVAKELDNYKFKNLSFSGASNFSIATQIEIACQDKNTELVIINCADMFRIDVPTVNFNRDEKMHKITDKNFTVDTLKKVAEKLYTEIYKNKFTTRDGLYDLINKEPGVLHKNKIYSSFAAWHILSEFEHIKYHFTPEVFDTMMKYFHNVIDINLRFHQDLALMEGKLYKLLVRKIPFLYNLGGITCKQSFHYRMFSEIIDKIENIDEFKPFRSSINLYDLTDRTVVHTSPAFHIIEEDIHNDVAEYYIKKINEVLCKPN